MQSEVVVDVSRTNLKGNKFAASLPITSSVLTRSSAWEARSARQRPRFEEQEVPFCVGRVYYNRCSSPPVCCYNLSARLAQFPPFYQSELTSLGAKVFNGVAVEKYPNNDVECANT